MKINGVNEIVKDVKNLFQDWDFDVTQIKNLKIIFWFIFLFYC
jgi:hypothetical protein